MLSDAEIAALTEAERAALLGRLTALAPRPPGRERARMRFFVVLTIACVSLIPWTVVLALTLPSHHTASRWDLTWVGFDVALIGALARTAWLAYKRRYAVVLWSVLTGTLLICDAWFDITTSAGTVELVGGVASALLGELPLTVLLFYVARRVLAGELRRTGAGRPVRLSKTPVS